MAKPDKRSDGALSASSIQPVLCEHGTLTLRLFNAEGDVYAVAVLSLDEALEFSLDITGQLNEYGQRIGAIPTSEKVH